ncbi:hypothetical protein ACFL5V_11020 [Fibrobacterota bacterium]
MNCKDTFEYFDEIIKLRGRFDNQSVKDHLACCHDCSAKLKQWEQIYFNLKSLKPLSPPQGLVEEILAASPPESAEFPPHPISTILRGPWLKPVLAMAAMLLLAVGIWQYNLVNAPQTPFPEEPRAETMAGTELGVSLSLPKAESVTLVGDFNGWDKTSHPLIRDREGNWKISLKLERGYFQYQILVDGITWMIDPNNPVQASDGFGGYNSVAYL